MPASIDPLGYWLDAWDAYLDGRLTYEQLPRWFGEPRAAAERPSIAVWIADRHPLPVAIARYRR